ncbi:hypothetical protein [Brevibacillus brevis]|uniref:PepSY domain-containing protein n=1 Tax=Brevibacillus brevis TaxID=1393 RepID=A0ABY9T8N8_BREBE|nr:hypothetical protein [Brevibacillus brevis]WNC16450.1 hypothetical protein RGB73_09070 [Brevibacillus brevis]
MKAKSFAASALAAVFLLSATPVWAASGNAASTSVYAKAEVSKASKKKAKKNVLSAEAAEEMVKNKLEELTEIVPQLTDYRIDSIRESVEKDVNGNKITVLVALLFDQDYLIAHLKLNAETGEVIIFDHNSESPNTDKPLQGREAVERAEHYLDFFLKDRASQFEYSKQYTYVLTGYPEEELPGKPFTLVTFTPKEKSENQPIKSANVLLDANGELHRYLVDIFPDFDEED